MDSTPRWSPRAARRALVCAAALLCVVRASAAGAQAPSGSDRLPDGAVAESLEVLRTLRARVIRNYKDAETWYRQGMIAWSLYERCRHEPPVKGLDCTRPRLLADSSLLIATELDTANTKYALTLSRYLLSSEGNFRRDSPYLDRLFKRTLEITRTSGNDSVYAYALVDAARLHWFRYDETAHRWTETVPTGVVRARARSLGGERAKLRIAADPEYTESPNSIDPLLLKQARNKLDGDLINHRDGFFGELDYHQTEYLLRTALEVVPTDLRAYRQLGVLLGARSRWGELGALARARLALLPRDAWAWMTAGMAAYRTGDRTGASDAFKNGYELLSSDDRRRVDRIERVLAPDQIAEMTRLRGDARADAEAVYWLRSDPLWSYDGDETRLEFLSRAAFAELMWTSEDLSLHGVDSDRGDVYIRNGPPDRIYSERGHGSEGGTQPPDMPVCGNFKRPGAWDTGYIRWAYDLANCMYNFDRLPTYKTTVYANELRAVAGRAATWNNLVHGRIDSIPTRIARFRAGADSVDLFFATLPPVAAIRATTEVVGPVRSDLWIMTNTGRLVARDSTLPAATGVRIYTPRVARGTYFLRTEASAHAALVAGRATVDVVANLQPTTGFSTRGFGLSDVLLGTDARARGTSVRRWNDLEVAPLFAFPERESTLAIVWETYDLGNDGGAARYGIDVSLRMARAQRTLGSAMAARVAGTVAGAIGFERRQSQDQVSFRYDRNVPHAAAVVDYLNISLGSVPAGNYVLTVQVTDRVTNTTTQRNLALVIAPRAARR